VSDGAPQRRLWEKGDPLDDRVRRFTVGRDPELDLALAPHDALASAAHATMLAEIGVLTGEEAEALVAELSRLATAARTGDFRIAPEEEDVHTALENRLIDALGDAGRRIHTGRSRNDQVIAALRLWGRSSLLEVAGLVLDVAGRLLRLAEEHRDVPVPGYTHTRQGMTSTLGFLFAAHGEALLDALPWIATAWGHVNRSPLGSASGYGVALPMDRPRVAELLGFDAVQENTLAVQNDRGKTEWLVLGAAMTPVLDLGRLAHDLIWFSAEELGFVRLGTAVTTGSSIMPQKRNPDGLELVRAASARLRARHGEIAAVFAGLTSGYHRDLQATKEPFFEGMTLAADAVAVMAPVLDALEVDPDACRRAVRPATAATDEVYRRVAQGVPFRTAYREVGEDPEGAVTGDPSQTWRLRTHLGAPGALSAESLAPHRERLAAGRKWVEEKEAVVRGAWGLLDGS
jgi:argininosuccinate lyase